MNAIEKYKALSKLSCLEGTDLHLTTFIFAISYV